MSGEVGALLLNLWEDAAASTVEVRTPMWPELRQFSTCLWDVFHTAAGIEELQQARALGFQAFRYLASTPLAPSDAVVELQEVIETCRKFANKWPTHSAAESVRSLAEAAQALSEVHSPFTEELEAVASRYESAVLLVPSERLREHVKAVLDYLELDGIQVATKSELRVGDRHFEAEIIIGDPAWTYASMRVSPSPEAQLSGWLFTAPPAPHVVVLLASGCQSIDSDKCWLLSIGEHPVIRLSDRHGKPFTLPPVTHHLTAEQSWHQMSVVPASPGVATSIAKPLSLVSGRIVFFSEEDPPHPRVLFAREDGGIDIRDVPLRDLRPASIILLRVGRSETEELRRRATEWLKFKKGWSDAKVDQTLEAAEQLKTRLQSLLATEGVQGVEARLQAEGLSEGYSRFLVRHPLRSDYIAPVKGYDAFVKVLGKAACAIMMEQKPLLVSLRSAIRQTGHDIRKEFETRLCSDTGWADDVDADGVAVIFSEVLGTVYLEVVAQVHDGEQQVATSTLGHLLTSTGTLFIEEGRWS